MKWDVKFTDFQWDFLTSRARFPAFVAGWGTGKTMTALAKGMALSAQYPGNKGLVLRKEFKARIDNMESEEMEHKAYNEKAKVTNEQQRREARNQKRDNFLLNK